MRKLRVVVRAAMMVAVLCIGEARAQTDQQLLDDIQQVSFQYFWNEANPVNGLVKDRSTPGSPASIAAVGFGLSSICVAIDHGWVTHTAGRDRVRTTLQTFWNAPQGPGSNGFIGYKGLYYHFLDMNTATRVWESELSTIDTALLFAGILDAKQYFQGSDPEEVDIRALADSIYFRADWEFMRNFNSGILHGWKPESGFAGFPQWIGYNEAMILYILALGSPTHPVPASTWNAWTSGYQWQTHYGYSYVAFGPLFGHQYSHCWVDFRAGKDAYMQNPFRNITYFENSRRATLAQRGYSIANPGGFAGYSDILWGLTASDDPPPEPLYAAHGAPGPGTFDNGTITPTAPASSLPFAPEVVLPVLRNMYNNYPSLWGPYGFRDAFNLSVNWYATDYLGIDQGPIVMMIENYRTQSVWNRFMLNPHIQQGLLRAGFVGVTGVDDGPNAGVGLELYPAQPNPFVDRASLRFRLAREGSVRLTLHDLAGREVARLVDGVRPAGMHVETVSRGSLASGVYYCHLQGNGQSQIRKLVLLQ